MTTPIAESIFLPLDNCWICGGEALVSSHEERFDLGAAAHDEDHRDVLGPYDGMPFVLNRCRDCGFMQPSRIPNHPKYFEVLYDQKWPRFWASEEFESTYKDRIFNGILDFLSRRIAEKDRTFLDVGAHVGKMVHLADRAGWRAEGIELNPRTAAFAEERTGRPIHRTDAAAMVQRGARFHAVVLTDVLEHIPNPLPLLNGLRKLMHPGGWIAVKVPHGPNQRRKEQFRHRIGTAAHARIAVNQVHVNHFNPKALRLALERVGFDEITIRVGVPELSSGGGLRGKISRMIRLITYGIARFPGGLHTPLALNLQAFARNGSR